MDIGDIDSPEDFEDPELKALDELVRCPICCDIMSTATMVTSCSHNFCSVCIRRHVESKKQCPICKEGCSDNALITNRLINQITVHYKRIRSKLISLHKVPSSLPIASTPTEPTNSLPPYQTSFNISLTSPLVQSPSQPLNQSSLKTSFKLTKRSKTTEVKTVGEASSYQAVAEQVNGHDTTEETQCPVCACSVPSRKVNLHLDMCLKRKQREERESTVPTKKKLPSLVWTMISDKKLREYCKQYNLTAKGRKAELIKRLKEYTLRYNAQIHQTKQQSDIELAREVERTERIQLKSPACVLVNLKSEQDRADYSKKHNGQFLKLINAARKTQKPGTSQKTQALDDDLLITYEHHTTPKKKCQGNLRTFFKDSPPLLHATSPISIHSFSPSSGASPFKVPAPNSFVSPVHRHCPTTPSKPRTPSAAKSLFATPVTATADANATVSILSQNSSNNQDLFDLEFEDDLNDQDLDDIDFEEIERSFTQQNTSVVAPLASSSRDPSLFCASSTVAHDNPPSPLTALSQPKLSASRDTPEVSRDLDYVHKRKRTKPLQQRNILEHVLAAVDNEYIEQEVSRLYQKSDDDTANIGSALNTSHVSKLDQLLEKSCKTPLRSRKAASLLNDSMADMLQSLDPSPGVSSPGVPSPGLPSPGLPSPGLPSPQDGAFSPVMNFGLPPDEIPSINEDDLPDCLEFDSLPTSPVIGGRTKRSSDISLNGGSKRGRMR